MSIFLTALTGVVTPLSIILLFFGVVVGVIFGAIPGLTAVTGVTLLLPLTFGFSPVVGMSLLLGVWIGGVSGGFIAASLLGIPGTPSAIATCFDAYPLSKSGKSDIALGLGIIASFIGTLFSVVVAAFISPIISKIALSFGPWEYFALGVTALTFVGSLAQGNVIKGLASAFLGLAFCTIGISPIDGYPRFTFGTVALSGGINILALVLGIYAIKQILHDVAINIKKKESVEIGNSNFKKLVKEFEFKAGFVNIIRSLSLGLWIGFLPGMGSGLSNLVAYSQAKNSSKHPELFGKGSKEGIIASELANNAAVGGSVIPMLTLGIPGDSVTAVLLGGLIIHGIQPGPLLFRNNPTLVYSIFILMGLAGIITFFLQINSIKLFPKILKIPYKYLYSVLIVMSFIGSFSSNNYFFDCIVMIGFAIIGLLLEFWGFSITPMILGFILGPMIELNLRRGLTYSTTGSFMIFLQRPISAVLLFLALISVVFSIVKQRKIKNNI